jgi:hypothetical protein
MARCKLGAAFEEGKQVVSIGMRSQRRSRAFSDDKQRRFHVAI